MSSIELETTEAAHDVVPPLPGGASLYLRGDCRAIDMIQSLKRPPQEDAMQIVLVRKTCYRSQEPGFSLLFVSGIADFVFFFSS